MARDEDYVNRMKIDTMSRLRDAVHDIINKLEHNQFVTIETLCERLEKRGLHIEPTLLKMILKRWEDHRDYSIFKKSDSVWLELDNDITKVKNAIHFQKPILAKHRRRIVEEEKEEKKKNKEGKVDIIYQHDPESGEFKRNVTPKGPLHNKVWVEANTIGGKYIPAHYEPSPYYAITDEVIVGTWVLDAKNARINEIRTYVFNLDLPLTYSDFWENMIKKGHEMKLTLHKDYMKFSPLEIIIKMNKRRQS